MTSVTSKRYSKTTYMILCGLFAAITAVCSFITIPLGFTPVPINLGTLAVFLTGGILAGPTGGYIIGYIVAVFIIGVLADVLVKRSTAGEQTASGGRAVKETLLYALAMVIGLLICYAFGTAWFMISTGTGLWSAMLLCVIPFLPGDALKIIVAAILVKKLRPLLN